MLHLILSVLSKSYPILTRLDVPDNLEGRGGHPSQKDELGEVDRDGEQHGQDQDPDAPRGVLVVPDPLLGHPVVEKGADAADR